MKWILTFAIIGLFTSCNAPSDTQESEQVRIASDTITVTSHTSRFERLTYPIKVIGKTRSTKRSNLIFERAGIIQSINITNGTYVRKGQIIATLKSADELLQKQTAEIALKKALVDYENEMLALGDSAYYKDQWLTVKENVQLNTGVLAAQVNLKKAQLTYNQTNIRAAISGIVEGISIQSGDFVSSNLKLGSIYDPASFEVICEVLEYDVLKIKKGMSASVITLANADAVYQGVVAEINPAVNDKGLARIIVRIQDSEDIIPGLSVRVEINVTDDPSIIIPLQAVVKRSERHVVFHIENGLAKWNYVTLGKDNGKEVQVIEGLKQDMKIITSNNLQLAHDSPVRVE